MFSDKSVHEITFLIILFALNTKQLILIFFLIVRSLIQLFFINFFF